MEEKQKFVTASARETEEVGFNFGKKLAPGNLVILNGQLGAGKTTFVQGVAKSLSIKSRIISPTFVLVRRHRGKIGIKKINLYHIDLYRMEGVSDINSLGLDDIFEDVTGIFLIEWGEKHENLVSNWNVDINDSGENKRLIQITKNE
ncbi:MAG TPA: tRNA (adenosine(37)-N6)-threonylcarbamoyltransferase complex ATPase subunit type 1 TsaE [Patescibacteria group bacterium]|nr:tRNA (adenosine(37)-N6)-threonylcarbamoyltransferase complex ATPase subunit type 1 TsaE [Patescibacteria group bacterium]